MNREQSIELFKKCEAARKEALEAGKNQKDAHEAAKAIWNAWANQLLEEKKQFENDGTWDENKEDWQNKADVTFIQCDFKIIKSEKITLDESESTENQAEVHTILCEGNIINLSEYIFPSLANFQSSTFSGYANFIRSTFSGNANFQSSTFSGYANFENSIFSGYANFENSTFSGNANFASSTFSGDANFQNSDFEDSVAFSESIFKGVSDFTALHSKRAFDLSKTEFENVPNFHQADFTQAPNLANVEVPIIEFWKSVFNKIDKNEIPKFRALRRLAIDGHDHVRERLFFKGEMRLKRGTEEYFYWNLSWWFSIFYDVFSDFGKSVWRPFVSWLILIPLFGWLYLQFSNYKCICQNISYIFTNENCYRGFVEGSYISTQNALIFFSINRKKEIEKAYHFLFGSDGNLPLYIGYIGALNSLLAAIFLFLILLGVRNLFKIST